MFLESLGIVAFALAGAVDAARARLDLFGLMVFATVNAIGGGVLRDLLLGVHPPVGLRTWWYLVVCGCTAVVVRTFYARAARLKLTVQVPDAIGLAMFAITGATSAMERGTPVYTAALIGLVNAIGGGIICQMMLGRVPQVLRGEIYALPALGAGLLTAVGHATSVPKVVLIPAVVVLVVGVRTAAVVFKWRIRVVGPLPIFPDDPTVKFAVTGREYLTADQPVRRRGQVTRRLKT